MDIVFKKTLMSKEDLVFIKQYGLPTPSLDRDNDSQNRELMKDPAYNAVQLPEFSKQSQKFSQSLLKYKFL